MIPQGNDVIEPFNVQIERESEPWSWCGLILAMISLFCCTVFGLVATVMAILSYVDHSTKKFARSKSKRSVVYGLAIAGIVIGSLITIASILLLIKYFNTVGRHMMSMYVDNNY